MKLYNSLMVGLLMASCSLVCAKETVLPCHGSHQLHSKENLTKEISGRQKLLSLVAGQWIAKSLFAAVELNLATHLANGPKTISDLAKLTHADEEHLYRLMRLLASVGVFYEGDNQLFCNTYVSSLLNEENSDSLRNLILFYSKEMSQSLDHLAEGVTQGTPAFDITFHEPVFAYFKENPESAALFNAAMKEKSKIVVNSCITAYDFSVFSSVYDIGGGTGSFLSELLKKFPTMQGLLYELPHVVKAAKEPMASVKRCSLVGGDFFSSIPSGGDAYLLKSILHDWNDDESLLILKKCHDVMSARAKLIIIEPILKEPNIPDFAKVMDVFMMAITGGKERTMQDFKTLLSNAGFRIDKVVSTETEFAIIQASKIR